MPSHTTDRLLAPTTAVALMLALGALLPALASAQGVYRIVGPDGKVSYSDQPPPAKANARPVAGASGAAASGPSLPIELRQAAARYPVTLYAAASDCGPCDKGRSFLSARGIPFGEKTVASADDIAAYKRLSNTSSLPMLAVGGQYLKGYSESEWAQYLDLAGYPQKSALPAGYRRAAATPLVAAKAAAPAAASAKKDQESKEPAEIPVTAPVSNPSGIKF